MSIAKVTTCSNQLKTTPIGNQAIAVSHKRDRQRCPSYTGRNALLQEFRSRPCSRLFLSSRVKISPPVDTWGIRRPREKVLRTSDLSQPQERRRAALLPTALKSKNIWPGGIHVSNWTGRVLLVSTAAPRSDVSPSCK